LKKVVIIGPESTGKSTLCTQLAAHFTTHCCPEYAREYLLENGTAYTYDDLLTIAKGQVALEEEYTRKVEDAAMLTQHGGDHLITKYNHTSPAPLPNTPLLFIDTNQYVMKVWSEFVFGKCHPYIIDQLAERSYDLYLLCNIDLAWVKDALREYPDIERREQLYNIYKKLLINQPVPWASIYGDVNRRFELAVKAVVNLFS
jgi:nicotinamide riboside kinase